MKTLLFVSHDGNRAGAQLFLYNIMLELKKHNYNIILLIINDWGNLRQDFETNFTTFYLNTPPKKNSLKGLFKKEKNSLDQIANEFKIDLIYANTIVSSEILDQLKTQFNSPIISHIHELSYSIHQFGSENALLNLFQYSDEIIACSNAVAENLKVQSPSSNQKISVVHSFVNNKDVLEIHASPNQKKEIFGNENFIIGACGNADWRKAPDIFLLIAKNVLAKEPNCKFVWIGVDKKDELFQQLTYDAKKLEIEKDIIWIEKTPKSVEIINSLDVFLVCSREDPFPLVMLEAALCEKPIVGFKNTGGAEEFIEDNAGFISSYLDIEEISNQIIALKNKPDLVIKYGKNAQNKMLNTYNFEQSIDKIKTIINKNIN